MSDTTVKLLNTYEPTVVLVMFTIMNDVDEADNTPLVMSITVLAPLTVTVAGKVVDGVLPATTDKPVGNVIVNRTPVNGTIYGFTREKFKRPVRPAAKVGGKKVQHGTGSLVMTICADAVLPILGAFVEFT